MQMEEKQLYLYGDTEVASIILALLSPENGADYRRAVAASYGIGETYGFTGDLMHHLIALALLSDENPFTLSIERRHAEKTSLLTLAYADLSLFYSWFTSGSPFTGGEYVPSSDGSSVYLRTVGQTIHTLTLSLEAASDFSAFCAVLFDAYEKLGVGEFALHHAFCLNAAGKLAPVSAYESVRLSDLWGYTAQKAALTQNTEAFLAHLPAGNVLLYGDAGTGKSSCVKALLNEYADRGLRMIAVQKEQLSLIPAVLEKVRSRPYSFVLYMDDLSFEETELEYKALKAIIEGGLQPRPDNVLIYATSNRRHLVRERWEEREGDDLHRNDNVQEKLSLASRFAVSIYFGKPLQDDYYEICRHLAARRGLEISDEELVDEARKFGLLRGGLSGRTAQQLVDMLYASKQAKQAKQ